MNDKSSIAAEIAALQVQVPSASRFQQQKIAAEDQRRKRRRHGPKGDGPRQYLPDAERKELVLRTVIDAAKSGFRCPTAQDYALKYDITESSKLFSLLASEGALRIEVFARNWRTVWICEGEHRGKHTQLPARGKSARPYVVLGPDRPK